MFVIVITLVAYIPYWQNGLGETIAQGYYMHQGVGMWFMMFYLAWFIIFYRNNLISLFILMALVSLPFGRRYFFIPLSEPTISFSALFHGHYKQWPLLEVWE